MKKTVFGLFALAFFALTSCQKESVGTDDTSLIRAIQLADNKVEIEESDLPSEASVTMRSDYDESYFESGKVAPGHGYEINIRRGESTAIGERSTIYFNERGRLLSPFGKKDRRKGNNGCNRQECFTFVFPVTLIMPDGNEITGESKAELRMAVKDWYEANPDVEEKPELQFPIEIEYEDGTVVSIADNEELRAAFIECKGDKMRDKCFELVFPVTFLTPDGTEISGESWIEIKQAIRDWKEANPGVEGRPELQFPVDIVYEDGTAATVNNKDEMKAAFEDCE